MNTSDEKRKPHSAEYFGEYRDFWWNADFLELMAKRLQLESEETIKAIDRSTYHSAGGAVTYLIAAQKFVIECTADGGAI